MRTFISFISVIGIFFLASCSDMNQDISPVSPQTGQLNLGPGPINPFVYDYMQTFERLEASRSDASKVNVVTVKIEGAKGPEDIVHAFAILNYNSSGLPGSSDLVFVGKPNSLTFEIPGYSPHGLSNVEVYAITSSDGLPITDAYDLYQSFQLISLESFSASNGQLKVFASAGQWTSTLIDVFAEVITKSGKYMVYLQKPSSSSFTIPVSDPSHVIGVRLFGRYQ